MPGRYYLKHMINHMVDNQERVNRKDRRFRNFLINKAVEYLKTTHDDLETRTQYVNYLTALTKEEVRAVVMSAKDDELFLARYGRTIQAEQKRALVIFLGLLYFL